jgi:hypothetical protein
MACPPVPGSGSKHRWTSHRCFERPQQPRVCDPPRRREDRHRGRLLATRKRARVPKGVRNEVPRQSRTRGITRRGRGSAAASHRGVRSRRPPGRALGVQPGQESSGLRGRALEGVPPESRSGSRLADDPGTVLERESTSPLLRQQLPHWGNRRSRPCFEEAVEDRL